MIEHSGEVSGFTAENIVFPDDSAAVVVLTNQDAAPASGAIAQQIARLLFTHRGRADREPHRAGARSIFEGLQRGTVDRSLFTVERERLLQRPGAQGLSRRARPARHADGIRADGAAVARRNDRCASIA